MRQAGFKEAEEKPGRQLRSKMIQIRMHAMKTANSTKQHRVAEWVHQPPRGSPSLEVTFELSLEVEKKPSTWGVGRKV